MEVCETLIELGLKSGEHLRTNHLHRETIAQALRLHEAETFAAQDYHRKEVQILNEQHRRKVLQERYIHEEDIDKEKSIATRDNIRDDWLQLAARAETVLIVNTLVLAVAFAMLIEGHLPLSATITNPVLTVAYFSAIASSICLLFSSVRFAVLLRLRVTITIVKEMRDAIKESGEEDYAFRNCAEYHWASSPWTGRPACDDKQFFTHSYLLQLRERRADPMLHTLETEPRNQQSLAAAEEMREMLASASSSATSSEQDQAAQEAAKKPLPLAFVNDGVPEGFESLKWIGSTATGFTVGHVRNALNRLGSNKIFDAAVARLGWLHVLTRQLYVSYMCPSFTAASGCNTPPVSHGGGLGVATPAFSDICGNDVHESHYPGEEYFDLASDDSEECSRIAPPEPLQSSLSASSRNEATSSSEMGADEQEREVSYRRRISNRKVTNDWSQEHLKTLQTNRCKPWEDAAQKLMSGGSVCLLLAACILMFGRFFFQAISLSSTQAIPGSALACWAFTAPCILTVLVLAYLEVLRQEWQAERDSDTAEANNADASGNQGRASQTATSSSPGDRDRPSLSLREKIRAGHRRKRSHPSAQAEEKQSAVCATGILLYGMPLSFFTFIIVAAVESLSKVDPHSTSAEQLHLQRPPLLATRQLSLAAGSTWPPFWEPSGAAWLPEQETLLLIGAGDVVEAATSSAGDTLHLSSAFHLKVSEESSLIGICVARAAQGMSWILGVDARLRIYASEANATAGAWHERILQPIGFASKVLRMPFVNSPEQQAAMSAGRSSALACGTSAADGPVQVWMTGNHETWPLLMGARLQPGVLSGISIGQSPSEVKPINITQYWHTKWLLVDSGVTSARVSAHLRGALSGAGHEGVTIGAAEVASNGGLLILISTSGPPQGALGDQWLVAVGPGGHVLRSWPLAPPAGGSRWAALAVMRITENAAGWQLLIVAGGPAPCVAAVEMPKEYL